MIYYWLYCNMTFSAIYDSVDIYYSHFGANFLTKV